MRKFEGTIRLGGMCHLEDGGSCEILSRDRHDDARFRQGRQDPDSEEDTARSL
jgi:hypothetical protein